MSTKLGPAANAIILQYSGPIHAAFLGWLILGERIKKIDYILLPVALCGTALCFIDSVNSGSLSGNIFGLISGFLFGLMVVLLRSLPNNSQGCVFMGNLLASLLAIPFLGNFDLSTTNLVGISTLGVFQIALPYILFSMALRRISAVEATMFTLIEPILNPVWVALILGETPSTLTIIGGVVVLVVLAIRTVVLNTSKNSFN
jgi:drug/metabolite transporter (DMT)-like permease